MTAFPVVMRFSAVLLLLVVCFSGCTSTQAPLEPGRTRLSELVRQLGQPTMVWSEGDGTLLVEFARADKGGANFMARVSPDGVMQSLQDVLTDARVATLVPGMSRDQVRRHLGQPVQIENGKEGEIWHWPLDSRRPAQWQIDAHFGAMGNLESVERTRIVLGARDTVRQAGQKIRSNL
ncbi:hypothetical protein ACFONG_06035 [Uliginosibacterium paludis]|uniref:Outer membrane protein assembly factor BamE n=1 Tax=Uliginosibacterium paludis TaxID=1615952 RepID=A0ABV2CVB2_9RHOO